MAWKGFTYESKKYMSYDRMNIFERFSFWLRFPVAFLRFKWYEIADAISGKP